MVCEVVMPGKLDVTPPVTVQVIDLWLSCILQASRTSEISLAAACRLNQTLIESSGIC